MCLFAQEEYEKVIDEFETIWEKTYKALVSEKRPSTTSTRAAFEDKMNVFRYGVFLLYFRLP